MTKIAVYGAGAVGSVIGAGIIRGGYDVTLIDPWHEHVEALNTKGLQLTLEGEGTSSISVKAQHSQDLTSDQRFDIIIFAVKSSDTKSALRLMSRHLAHDGFIVSAQNGINEDILVPEIGAERIVGCVITFAAALPKAGYVVRTTPPGTPSLILGEVNSSLTQRLASLKEMLQLVGSTRLTDNLLGERWAKLINNAMMNPVAGLTGLGSRAIRLHPQARALAIKIGSEGVSVALALGIQVTPILGGIEPSEFVAEAQGFRTGIVEKLISEAQRRGDGSPSLLQDIQKGRKTEIDFLNGVIVRRGEGIGVPTPINRVVIGLIKDIEAGRLRPAPENVLLLENAGQ